MTITASVHDHLEVRNSELLVWCFRQEGEECSRCNGSGYRPCKRCAGCGEHRSLMRNPADDQMYCLSCNPRFLGAELTLLGGMGR